MLAIRLLASFLHVHVKPLTEQGCRLRPDFIINVLQHLHFCTFNSVLLRRLKRVTAHKKEGFVGP